MKLSEELENLVIQSALGKVEDSILIEYVKAKLSTIPKNNNEYDELNRKRLLKTTSADYSNGRFTVDSILGNYINLTKLEEERKLQIETNSEKLAFCKVVDSAQSWLSGGLTVYFFDNKDQKHSIGLHYPLGASKIRIFDISGALYVDNRLVPVRSNLESEIIIMLKKNHCEDDLDGVIDSVIHFVESNIYFENAKKIGRIG